MAQRRLLLDQENFSCSICLDLLKEPVTVPCGHSYCMSCIQTYWDDEDQRRIYNCPQCRKIFIPRPVLEKNIMLAELVEELKKTNLRSSFSYAGPEDVSCDVCAGRKMKSVESCLDSLEDCEEHLQPHSNALALQKHELVNPSRNLQQNICSLHYEVMKIFCRTDQRCICYLCLMDEHRGHDKVSAAVERTEKQKKLEEIRQQILEKIKYREKDMRLFQQEVENINTSADKAVEDSEEIFSEMICLLQKRSSEVKQQIRSQQGEEVNRVLDLQEKLEQEINDLKSKDKEMEQLSHTEDHSQFLLHYPSLPPLSESTHSSSINVRPLRYFEDVTAVVADTRDKLQELLRDSWTNITLTVDVLPPKPEPKTREDFLKYSRDVTLDPNTANMYLSLSEGNRKATVMKQKRSYFTHPDTFTVCPQVLSRERLTGRRYWEVEWGGQAVYVTVAYRDTPRSGDCLFGWNDRSWSLYCGLNVYQFCRNKVQTPVSGPGSSRVGVYLDHRAGVLSFYSVSESMTLLHRVQTTFTQPLHAGFRFCCAGDSAELIKLKQTVVLSLDQNSPLTSMC